MNSKKLILFDFDGTITTKDTFIEFIKFNTSTIKFYSTIWIVFLFFILQKAKFFNAKKAKELSLSLYFYSIEKSKLENISIKFINHLINQKIIKPSLIDYIQSEKSNQAEIAIVSASLDFWIQPFCTLHQLTLIATQANYVNGIFYGNIASNNCNGEEKAIRIKEVYDLSNYTIIEVHGNSKGDIPMMNLGTKKIWY